MWGNLNVCSDHSSKKLLEVFVFITTKFLHSYYMLVLAVIEDFNAISKNYFSNNMVASKETTIYDQKNKFWFWIVSEKNTLKIVLSTCIVHHSLVANSGFYPSVYLIYHQIVRANLDFLIHHFSPNVREVQY